MIKNIGRAGLGFKKAVTFLCQSFGGILVFCMQTGCVRLEVGSML